MGVKDSVFEYWASILRLRKTHKEVFIYGNFELLDAAHSDVFAYSRTFEDRKVIVVTNFRQKDVTWSLPKGIKLQKESILVSNYSDMSLSENGSVALRPFEAFACGVD